MKLSFNKKVNVTQPVKGLQVYDADQKQSFLNHPLVQEAVKKAEQRAFDQGFQQGFEQGLKKKAEELKDVIACLREAAKQLSEAEKKVAEQLEPQVVDLCIKAAEVVIGREIDKASADLERIIKPILAKVPDATRIIIRVNPQDLNQLREFSNDIVADGKIESLEVVSDENIAKGGCVIETDVGTIDATIETRISQMKDSLQARGGEG